MDIFAVRGYNDDRIRTNTIRHIDSAKMRVVAQVATSGDDKNGFPSSETLEVAYDEYLDTYAVVRSTLQQELRPSRYDAELCLQMSCNKEQLATSLRALADSLETYTLPVKEA